MGLFLPALQGDILFRSSFSPHFGDGHHPRKEMEKKCGKHLDSVSAGGLFLKKAFCGEDEKTNIVKCFAERTGES